MKIPIVDRQDNILYHKDDVEHDPTKEITRTSALWLCDEKGELLIAKRSKNKKFHPNLWNLSVSGKHEEGETYESNILKEVKEELGITLNRIDPGFKEFIPKERLFFVKYFFARIPKSTVLTLQESEVDAIRWVFLTELKKWFSEKPQEFSSHFDYTLRAVEKYANQS